LVFPTKRRQIITGTVRRQNVRLSKNFKSIFSLETAARRLSRRTVNPDLERRVEVEAQVDKGCAGCLWVVAITFLVVLAIGFASLGIAYLFDGDGRRLAAEQKADRERAEQLKADYIKAFTPGSIIRASPNFQYYGSVEDALLEVSASGTIEWKTRMKVISPIHKGVQDDIIALVEIVDGPLAGNKVLINSRSAMWETSDKP
jgi:hypothetical protein